MRDRETYRVNEILSYTRTVANGDILTLLLELPRDRQRLIYKNPDDKIVVRQYDGGRLCQMDTFAWPRIPFKFNRTPNTGGVWEIPKSWISDPWWRILFLWMFSSSMVDTMIRYSGKRKD